MFADYFRSILTLQKNLITALIVTYPRKYRYWCYFHVILVMIIMLQALQVVTK